MRLAVPVPARWKRRDIADGTLYESPDRQCALIVGALGGAHEDPETWIPRALVAYFCFIDYAATVVAVCRDPDAQPSWRREALELLAQAQPDFSTDGVTGLADILG